MRESPYTDGRPGLPTLHNWDWCIKIAMTWLAIMYTACVCVGVCVHKYFHDNGTHPHNIVYLVR